MYLRVCVCNERQFLRRAVRGKKRKVESVCVKSIKLTAAEKPVKSKNVPFDRVQFVVFQLVDAKVIIFVLVALYKLKIMASHYQLSSILSPLYAV